MKRFLHLFEIIRNYIELQGLHLLRYSVGIIFLWFGLLKFFPGSAAENLAQDTISWIIGDAGQNPISLYVLGFVECVIGLSILTETYMSHIIPVMYVQMVGTILPLFIFPEKTWIAPFMPSLQGQYIIKNIVFLSAGIILGAAGKGSKLIIDPKLAGRARKVDKEKAKD